MERTLVILKPSAIQRALAGEVIRRFERKGLKLCGIKMMQLSDELIEQHYAHLVDRPFFPRIKESMQATPVIVCCWEGIEAVQVVRELAGTTNGRKAAPGSIRGDFGVSVQENIIHASDTVENATIELNRFFGADEIFDYQQSALNFIYASDEL